MRLRELISYMPPSIAETANRHMQRLDEMQSKIDSMMINLGTPTLEPLVNTFVYEESDDDIEVTLAYTLSLNLFPHSTIEPTDTLLMADEVISTTPARENDKLIKSSIDALVSIPWVLEVTSICDDLECDMPIIIPLPTIDVREEYFDINSPLGEYVVEFLMENVDVAGLPRHLKMMKDLGLVMNLENLPELTPVIDEPTLLDTLPLSCTDVLGDALVNIDLPLGEPLDTLSTEDREIKFNPSRDIEELEHLLANDPVLVPRVFDDPLGNSDSISRSFEISDLFEELIAEIGLDDSILIRTDDRYYDSEDDILFFEPLLNEDTSSDVSPALLPTKSSSLVLPFPILGSFDHFVEIPSGESKVHIEVLSVLWGNRLPIPDGSLPLTPDVSVFKKVEGILEVEIRLLALSVRTPDVYKGLKTKPKRWPLLRIDRLAFRLSSLWKAEWWCSDLVSMAWSCPDCPFFVNFSPGFLSMSGFVQFLHGDWSHIDVASKNYEGSSKASVYAFLWNPYTLFPCIWFFPRDFTWQDCTRSNDVDCNAYSFLCSCWLRLAYGDGSKCVDWSQHVMMIQSLLVFSVQRIENKAKTLGLRPLLSSHSRGLEFDSGLRLHYICHVSSHVDAMWAHVADTWIHVACHVVTIDWRSTTVDRWFGSCPMMVRGTVASQKKVNVVNGVLASGVDMVLEKDLDGFALQEMKIHPMMFLIQTLLMILQTFSPTLHNPGIGRIHKSSVENLVPIPSESEDNSGSDSDCDLPSCNDFSLINIPKGKSVTFSNPLFDSNDDFTSSDDESLSDEDVPKNNVKIYSTPLFKFDDEYISSDVNPLFDEVLENIKSKDSYVSNFDEPDLLVTPLSDANEMSVST
ncbi:hypothetical protein Tco_0542276 [Tanacetum coccineum]